MKQILLSILAVSPLVASLSAISPAISGEIPSNAIAQASSGSTSFQCINFGSDYATIAVAGGKKTNPLIIYQNRVFSASGYTPEVRCQEISGRFQTAVANNGGKLKSLLLTVGEVNGLDVICYVNNKVLASVLWRINRKVPV